MSSGQKGIIISMLGYCEFTFTLRSENSSVKMTSLPTDQHTNHGTLRGERLCQKSGRTRLQSLKPGLSLCLVKVDMPKMDTYTLHPLLIKL